MINHLLYDLGSPANIGSIIRLLHVLGDSRLYIFDPRGNLEAYAEAVARCSTGLSWQQSFLQITDIDHFLQEYQGRKIATEISDQAVPLNQFRFQSEDLIIYGNENRGIPEPIIQRADARVVVPMLGRSYPLPATERPVAANFGQHPNLNVSHTVAIVAYEGMRQMGAFDGFKLR